MRPVLNPFRAAMTSGVVACLSLALPAQVAPSSASDHQWQQVQKLTHGAQFAFVDRDLKCATGRIHSVNGGEVVVRMKTGDVKLEERNVLLVAKALLRRHVALLVRTKKQTITCRADRGRVKALDMSARSLDRDRSYLLNAAVDQYLSLHAHHVEEIEKGLQEARSGKLIPSSHIKAGWTKRLDR